MNVYILFLFFSTIIGSIGLFIMYKHILNKLDETKKQWESIKQQNWDKLDKINKVIT